MKIDDKEIDRLMYIVSDDLRSRWEGVMNQGLSLFIAKRDRVVALAKIKHNDMMNKWINILGLALVVIISLVIPYTSIYSAKGVIGPVSVGVVWSILLLMFTICVVWIWRLGNKNRAARQKISDCDEIFSRFVRSINLLGHCNPHGLCAGEINEFWVKERLVWAAYSILDAQAGFAKIRINLEFDWHSVTRSGNWIEQCEGVFDRIWNAATQDFGLELDKGEIFKRAAKWLERDNAKIATTKG